MANDKKDETTGEEPGLENIPADAVIESVPAEIHERILATDGNAVKIAAIAREFKQGFDVKDKDGKEALADLIKEVLILVDSYERSYDAKKLEPAITAKAFSGMREVFEAGLKNLKAAGCDTMEPDEELVAKIKGIIGDKAWRSRVGGPIYNKAAFAGFASAVALFDNHKAETFKALETAGK